MRYLVLGSNGMAGHMISLYLKEKGHFVTGFAREKLAPVETVTGDAHESAKLESLIKSGKFDVVVNALGILNRSAEENRDEAVYINSFIPHFLSRATREAGAYLVHISTDCVFSGDRGGYKEDDERDCTSFYGRSKALGEIEDAFSVTLRTSFVGPDMKRDGIGLFNWFMKSEESVYGYTNAIWTGLTTLEFASSVEKVTSERIHGIYNLVPDVSISKYELLKLFSFYFRKGEVKVIPSSSFVSDRSLIRTRNDFTISFPSYDEMISRMKRWMECHRDLYPHYFPS